MSLHLNDFPKVGRQMVSSPTAADDYQVAIGQLFD